MKQYIPILFFIIFIGIIIAANIYLSRRFNYYFSIENSKILNFVFPALSFLMFFGMMPLSNTTNGFGSLVYILAALTMGTLLYLVLSVFTIDIIGLFTKLLPKTMGVSALLLTLLIVAGGIFNAWNVRVLRQDIQLKGISEEVKIMHLSDIHIGHFRGKRFLQSIVEKTKQQNVDVVFITGDLFDGKINLNLKELAPLKELDVPVYFVDGNHDKYSGVKTIKKYLEELDVEVLENEVTHFGELQLIGLNHMSADSGSYNMHASSNGPTIQSTLNELNLFTEKPTILLHHSPDGIQYANQYGVDLYLAGHTHGGQLFPVKYVANLIFDYNKGHYIYNNTQLYVSQGAGTFGPPMRVGTKSEITVLTLKPQS